MDEARHRQLRTIGGIPDCGPLSGIFVADFGTHAVGAVTSSYLAMLGATVLKIEANRRRSSATCAAAHRWRELSAHWQ